MRRGSRRTVRRFTRSSTWVCASTGKARQFAPLLRGERRPDGASAPPQNDRLKAAQWEALMSGDNKALSPADRFVLRNLVDRHARERGESVFALFSTG